jgi:replicative DNA helicase
MSDLELAPTLYSRESEEALLGAILINPDAYYSVAGRLRGDDFFIHRHRWIWEAFSSLVDQHIPVDLLTTIEALNRHGQLAEVGGPAYLTGLINATPTSLHAEAYAGVIMEHAGRRRLLDAANAIAKFAYQTGTDFETTLSEAEKAIFTVSQQRLGGNLRSLAEVVDGVYDQAAALANQTGDLLGVPSGFTDLDALLGGWQGSDLVLVAGRPGMGKTSLLLSWLRAAAQSHHKRVAVFTLEMSAEQLAQRLLAQAAGIDAQRLRSGRMTADEWVRFIEAIEVFSSLNVFIEDTPALNPYQLRSACRRLQMEVGLDLVMVDYLQLMSGGTRYENRVQEVGAISRQLKNLAKELDVPILAAAQLNRSVEQRADKKPTLADLRESGNLEQDADVVILMHRPQPGMNVISLEVAKHRKGPVGTVDLIFRPDLTRFENALTVDLNQEKA